MFLLCIWFSTIVAVTIWSLSEQKPSGVGGETIAGGPQTCVLNAFTVLGPNPGHLTLHADNTFTLRPGSYLVFGQVPIASVNLQGLVACVVNNATGLSEIRGTSMSGLDSGTGGAWALYSLPFAGTLSITTPTVYRVDIWADPMGGPAQMGLASSQPSAVEVYTQLTVTRFG
jgi:hypothetical protein